MVPPAMGPLQRRRTCSANLGLILKCSVAHCSTPSQPLRRNGTVPSANCQVTFKMLGIHKTNSMCREQKRHNLLARGPGFCATGRDVIRHLQPSRVPTHVWSTAPISSYLYVLHTSRELTASKKNTLNFFSSSQQVYQIIFAVTGQLPTPSSSITTPHPALVHLENHVA